QPQKPLEIGGHRLAIECAHAVTPLQHYARPSDISAQHARAQTRDVMLMTNYERALASLHSSRGDALTRIHEVLARNPGFLAGHCLRAAALILAGDAPDRHRLAGSIHAIEQQGVRANDRERRHAFAARAILKNDERLALERYGELLIDYPTDSLALQVAHSL